MTKVLEIIREATLIILGIIFSSCIVVLADCNSTVSSQDVSYDNSTIKAELDTILNDLESYRNVSNSSFKTALLNAFYPVGSIYISTSSTNPGTSIGGTWVAFGQGRTLVGVGNNGTTNYTTVSTTGGAESISYTPSGTVTNFSIANHNYKPQGTTTGAVGTSSVSAHATFTPNCVVGGTAITIETMPAHNHPPSDENNTYGENQQWLAFSATGNGLVRRTNSSGTYNGSNWLRSPGSSVDRQDSTTGMRDTNLNTPSSTGNPHTHTITAETSTALTHNVTAEAYLDGQNLPLAHTVAAGATTYSATATTFSTVQPYITVYMWKRTA